SAGEVGVGDDDVTRRGGRQLAFRVGVRIRLGDLGGEVVEGVGRAVRGAVRGDAVVVGPGAGGDVADLRVGRGDAGSAPEAETQQARQQEGGGALLHGGCSFVPGRW